MKKIIFPSIILLSLTACATSLRQPLDHPDVRLTDTKPSHCSKMGSVKGEGGKGFEVFNSVEGQEADIKALNDLKKNAKTMGANTVQILRTENTKDWETRHRGQQIVEYTDDVTYHGKAYYCKR